MQCLSVCFSCENLVMDMLDLGVMKRVIGFFYNFLCYSFVTIIRADGATSAGRWQQVYDFRVLG